MTSGQTGVERNPTLRVLVIGMGALGRIYAESLDGPVDVRGLARTGVQADQISRGFTVQHADGNRFVRIICHPRDDGWQGDIGILLTKSNDTSAAMNAAADLLSAQAPVITLQNGLGNREKIAALIGPERAGWGVSFIAATSVGASTVRLVNAGETIFGRLMSGAEPLAELIRALSACGLPSSDSAYIERTAWLKLVQASAMNVTGALSGLNVGAYWKNPEWRRFAEALVEEGVRVAAAEGIGLDTNSLIDKITWVAEQAPETVPSMLQDIRRGRQTEIESMTGELVRRAERHSLHVPVLRRALNEVRSLDRSRL
jgi:2-dehydropantoate 2-reductase